ncbi:hypothetical protein Vretimale_4284 [Volvox reticuliferus]|uniref:Uncharacterized protein n=1 Tax=Volvox reticuliferus TaxID=1737510 RepID=A0A8J4DAU3_9CHLO|nr:hypothetical protein Vretimale_4284 [Volvox reticuliferus]
MSKPTGQFPRKANLPDPYSPCPNEKCHASTRNIRNLSELEYWAAICPHLSVGGRLEINKKKRSKQNDEDFRRQMHDEGVFQVYPSEMQWPVDIHRLALNMVTLMQHGWPATFLLMFDEVWALIERASGLMVATTGNTCNMDVLCWYVDPNGGAAGFSPHRDRQPDDSPATFRPGDSSPMYSTCWVPLTDACPENSCLYMVPRWADPGYYHGDDDDGPDPLSVALSSKESFQSIRAFPAEAGSAIIFSHRIIHWGSRGRKGFHTPRLAISWGCADDAYEPPYFSRQYLPYPPMELRAALACGQMLVYHERFPMAARQLSLYYKFFNLHADKFQESYRAKVASEFVAATKELVMAGAAPGPGRGMASNGATHGGGDESRVPMNSNKVGTGEKKKKKRSAGEGSGHADADTFPDVKGGGSNAAAPLGGKGLKKAKKAAVPGCDKDLAAAHLAIGGAQVAATLTAVSLAAKKARKDKKVAGKTAAVPVTALGKEGALQGQPAAAESRKKGGRKAVNTRWSQDGDDDDDDDEEEGPGWEGLLVAGGGGGGDSDDEVMEDALDAMLDAKLAGREDGLVDDFDDF